MYILWGKCFKKEIDWKMVMILRVIIVYYYIILFFFFGSIMKVFVRFDFCMVLWWE